MARQITLTFEATDAEITNLLARFAERGQVNTADNDDDAGPVNTAAPQTDKNGVPWIESVHASTKAMNKDGTWRGRKGVDDATRQKAEAEAKVALAASGHAAPVGLPGAGVAPAPQPAETFTIPGFLTPGQTVALPGMPGLPGPAPKPPVSMDELIAAAQTAIGAGKTTPQAMGAWYAEIGVIDPNTLINDGEKRRALMDKIEALG